MPAADATAIALGWATTRLSEEDNAEYPNDVLFAMMDKQDIQDKTIGASVYILTKEGKLKMKTKLAFGACSTAVYKDPLKLLPVQRRNFTQDFYDLQVMKRKDYFGFKTTRLNMTWGIIRTVNDPKTSFIYGVSYNVSFKLDLQTGQQYNLSVVKFGNTYLDSYAFMENLPSRDVLLYIDNTQNLTILWRANGTVLSQYLGDNIENVARTLDNLNG